MIFLPKCLAQLAQLTAAGQGRYAMQALRLRELAGQHWRVEVSDGRPLAIVRGPSQPAALGLKAAGALPEPEALALEALVPTPEFVKALRAVPKDGGRREERRLGVLLAGPQVLLVSGDTVARVAPVEGRFPDVDSVLPKGPAPVSF